MSNYCSNCGNKLDEGELFCPECGSKIVEKNNASKKAIIDEDDKISKKIKERSEKFNSKNNNSSTLFDKINLKLVIVIVFLAIIGFVAISSISHNDIIEIQGVDMDYRSGLTPTIDEIQNNDPNTDRGKLNLNAVPKQTINHVTDVRLENVVLTLKNGTTRNYNPVGLGVNWNGVGLPSGDVNLYEGNSYDLKCTFKLPAPVTHITGDLVVDTTSDKNMICGHVDSDIVSEK